MKQNIVNFLRRAFPFFLTVGLWRLSVNFWNPAGLLAIIPIFFCTFVRPVNWFVIFSVLMCICLDYKSETVCFWLAVYCLFYSINAFQNFIDITRMDNNGLFAFMVFFGLAILVLVLSDFTWGNIAHGIWIFIWACAIYLPVTQITKKVHHD